MTADPRRGALDPAAGARTDRLVIAEVPAPSIVNARGADQPARPNTVVWFGEVAALWLGPDEWLLIGDRPISGGPAAGAGRVDVSAQYTTIAVTGPAARDVLAHGCALDLDRTGPDWCAQTTLARAAVIIWPTAPDGYRLIVRRSFARYLMAWLLDASVEDRLGGFAGATTPPHPAG